jgi:hypothetical protein
LGSDAEGVTPQSGTFTRAAYSRNHNTSTICIRHVGFPGALEVGGLMTEKRSVRTSVGRSRARICIKFAHSGRFPKAGLLKSVTAFKESAAAHRWHDASVFLYAFDPAVLNDIGAVVLRAGRDAR